MKTLYSAKPAVMQDMQTAQTKLADLAAQMEAKQQVLNQLRGEIPQLEQHASTQSQAKQLAESTYFALRDEITASRKSIKNVHLI